MIATGITPVDIADLFPPLALIRNASSICHPLKPSSGSPWGISILRFVVQVSISDRAREVMCYQDDWNDDALATVTDNPMKADGQTKYQAGKVLAERLVLGYPERHGGVGSLGWDVTNLLPVWVSIIKSLYLLLRSGLRRSIDIWSESSHKFRMKHMQLKVFSTAQPVIYEVSLSCCYATRTHVTRFSSHRWQT